jgi:CRP-like cAMP-binding protein
MEQGGVSSPIPLTINRVDISDYLDLTTETVSCIFTRLKVSGTIQWLPQNMIELADLDMPDGRWKIQLS